MSKHIQSGWEGGMIDGWIYMCICMYVYIYGWMDGYICVYVCMYIYMDG